MTDPKLDTFAQMDRQSVLPSGDPYNRYLGGFQFIDTGRTGNRDYKHTITGTATTIAFNAIVSPERGVPNSINVTAKIDNGTATIIPFVYLINHAKHTAIHGGKPTGSKQIIAAVGTAITPAKPAQVEGKLQPGGIETYPVIVATSDRVIGLDTRIGRISAQTRLDLNRTADLTGGHSISQMHEVTFTPDGVANTYDAIHQQAAEQVTRNEVRMKETSISGGVNRMMIAVDSLTEDRIVHTSAAADMKNATATLTQRFTGPNSHDLIAVVPGWNQMHLNDNNAGYALLDLIGKPQTSSYDILELIEDRHRLMHLPTIDLQKIGTGGENELIDHILLGTELMRTPQGNLLIPDRETPNLFHEVRFKSKRMGAHTQGAFEVTTRMINPNFIESRLDTIVQERETNNLIVQLDAVLDTSPHYLTTTTAEEAAENGGVLRVNVVDGVHIAINGFIADGPRTFDPPAIITEGSTHHLIIKLGDSYRTLSGSLTEITHKLSKITMMGLGDQTVEAFALWNRSQQAIEVRAQANREAEREEAAHQRELDALNGKLAAADKKIEYGMLALKDAGNAKRQLETDLRMSEQALKTAESKARILQDEVRFSNYMSHITPSSLARAVEIPKGSPIIIGVSPDVDMHLSNLNVAGKHAQVVWETNRQSRVEGYFIYDLNSTNGTFLNGIQCPSNTPIILEAGDIVSLGANVGSACYLFYEGQLVPMPNSDNNSSERYKAIKRSDGRWQKLVAKRHNDVVTSQDYKDLMALKTILDKGRPTLPGVGRDLYDKTKQLLG
jgi:pSer/pThr/pTyr-binding forkhead associated (FHA) protein